MSKLLQKQWQHLYSLQLANQLGDNWLGGSGAAFLKGVADVFVNSGNIPSARGSYANAINTDGLEGLAAQ